MSDRDNQVGKKIRLGLELALFAVLIYGSYIPVKHSLEYYATRRVYDQTINTIAMIRQTTYSCGTVLPSQSDLQFVKGGDLIDRVDRLSDYEYRIILGDSVKIQPADFGGLLDATDVRSATSREDCNDSGPRMEPRTPG